MRQPWLAHWAPALLIPLLFLMQGYGTLRRFWQLHGAYHLRVCALASPPFVASQCCCFTPIFLAKRVCFSNVKSQWESEAALWRDSDCFPRKMERAERNGERVRAKGDDDCFPLLAWLILPKEEIVRLSGFADRFLALGRWPAQFALYLCIYLFLSLYFLPLFFCLSVCHLVSIMFSQIIAFHCK